MQDADTAVYFGKTAAVSNNKPWFNVLAERTQRQAAEVAEKRLADSRTNENKACQLQQDSGGFSPIANGKYKLAFDCNHSAAGNCAAALKAYETVPKRCSGGNDW